MFIRLLLVAFLFAGTVVVPTTKPGDILVDQQGNITQDLGHSIITPNGVIIRQEDQSQKFQDTYKDTMQGLKELQDSLNKRD